jgi:hypothetical protein
MFTYDPLFLVGRGFGWLGLNFNAKKIYQALGLEARWLALLRSGAEMLDEFFC